MTTPAHETQPPPAHSDAGGYSCHDISLTRIYLPFAMVVTFGLFLTVAGYAAGGIMSGIARDKTETEKRLTAIEKEVTAIKNILAERVEFPQGCFPKDCDTPGPGGRTGLVLRSLRSDLWLRGKPLSCWP